MSLWVFFFICCSIFSFLLNVRLRRTLGYVTNLPFKWESLSHWYTPPSGSIFKYEYLNHKRSSLVPLFTYLNGTRLSEISVRKTFDTGIKLHSYEPVTATNLRLWYHLMGKAPLCTVTQRNNYTKISLRNKTFSTWKNQEKLNLRQSKNSESIK